MIKCNPVVSWYAWVCGRMPLNTIISNLVLKINTFCFEWHLFNKLLFTYIANYLSQVKYLEYWKNHWRNVTSRGDLWKYARTKIWNLNIVGKPCKNSTLVHIPHWTVTVLHDILIEVIQSGKGILMNLIDLGAIQYLFRQIERV